MQDNRFDEARARVDRENVFLWRRTPRRLEAEPIRDAMLATAGRLDSRMYGPGSLDPEMPRRSVYFFIKRSQLIPMMMLFDWPEHLVSIGQRSTTTTAPQALAMLNSALARHCAAGFAARVAGGDPASEVGAGLPDRLRPRTDRVPRPGWRPAFLAAPALGLRARRPARARSVGPRRFLPGPDRHERVHLYSLNADAGVSSMIRPIPDGSQAFLSRRRWLQRAGGGFGLIGLAGLLQREGLLDDEGRGRGGIAQPDGGAAGAFPRPGEAGHLDLRQRRAEPGRHLGVQAGARALARPVDARSSTPRSRTPPASSRTRSGR